MIKLYRQQTLKIKKVLVSQPKPTSEKSPYYDIAEKYGMKIDFRPFIKGPLQNHYGTNHEAEQAEKRQQAAGRPTAQDPDPPIIFVR